MLSTILFALFYLILAIIVLEILLYIFTLIFPTFVLNARLRGLFYALALICVVLYVLNHL